MQETLRALVPTSGDLRPTVKAAARVLLARAEIPEARKPAASAAFTAWDGAAPMDEGLIVRSLLDWPAEQAQIRSALLRGERPAHDGDPVTDGWANALGDLAFATRYHAKGDRWMTSEMIVSALERAAYVSAGVARGDASHPAALSAAAELCAAIAAERDAR